jgi:hypothetical protein
LAASTTAANCFTGRMFQYAQGREANEDDACLLTDLRQKFLASKGNITSLAAETAAKNALAQRKVP